MFSWFTRKRITTVLGAILLILGVSLAAACTHSNNAQTQESKAQAADSKQLDNAEPVPEYSYSQIRQTLIDAETAEAATTQTTSFMFQMGDPDPVASCPSIGYPVANTASLTNPSQPYQGGVTTDGGDVVGQEDPNGIYTPTTSSGTYVICNALGGQHYLFYWEGDVMTVGGPATWDTATHSAVVTGAPTATVHIGAPGK